MLASSSTSTRKQVVTTNFKYVSTRIVPVLVTYLYQALPRTGIFVLYFYHELKCGTRMKSKDDEMPIGNDSCRDAGGHEQ